MFFSTDIVRKGLDENNMSEKDLYANLVQYLYNKSASADFAKRKTGCCWLVYLKELWKLKSYCNVKESEIGVTIFKELFKNEELLNTKDQVVLNKFRDEFQIASQLSGTIITQERVVNFAMQIDARHPDLDEMKASTSIGAISETKSELGILIEHINAMQFNNNNNNNNNNKPWSNDREMKCFNCGETGHSKRGCNKPMAKCGGCSGMHTDVMCDFIKQFYARKQDMQNNWRNKGEFSRHNGYGTRSPGYNGQNGFNSFGSNNAGHRNSNYNNQNDNRGFSNQTSARNTSNIPFQPKHKSFAAMSIDMAKLSFDINKGGDLRKYVQVGLESGTPMKSLCDTGASASGIDATLLQEHGIADLIKAGPDMVKMANGELTPSIGTIDIKCQIEGSEHNVTFAVIGTLCPKIILGAPLLKSVGVMDKFDRDIDNAFRNKTASEQSKN